MNSMNKKTIVIVLLIGLMLFATSVVFMKAWTPATQIASKADEPEEAPRIATEAMDSSITVAVARSKGKDNTVALTLQGLGGNVRMVAYEVSYESQGIVQGVTSKPLDVSGKDTFVRDDIYLGTCSRNVCRPHPGVKSVSVVLELQNANGTKSQFSREFLL